MKAFQFFSLQSRVSGWEEDLGGRADAAALVCFK